METSFTDRERKEYYQELVDNRFVIPSAAPLPSDYSDNHPKFLSKLAIGLFFKNAVSSAPIARALPEAETTQGVDFDSPRQKTSDHITIIHNYGNNNSNNDIYYWLWLFDRRGNQAAPVAQNNTQTNNTNKHKSDFVAFMLVLIILGAVVIPTAISAYYLTSELYSNLERLW